MIEKIKFLLYKYSTVSESAVYLLMFVFFLNFILGVSHE